MAPLREIEIIDLTEEDDDVLDLLVVGPPPLEPINYVDIHDVEVLEQVLLEHDENPFSINSDSTEPLPDIGPEEYDGASLQAEGDRIIPVDLDILNNLLFGRQATVVRGDSWSNLEIAKHSEPLMRRRNNDAAYNIVHDSGNAVGKFLCCVCLDRIVNTVMPCGHAFCVKCGVSVLRRKVGCPCCRELPSTLLPLRLAASGEVNVGRRLDACELCLDVTATADRVFPCGHVACMECTDILMRNAIPCFLCSEPIRICINFYL